MAQIKILYRDGNRSILHALKAIMDYGDIKLEQMAKLLTQYNSRSDISVEVSSGNVREIADFILSLGFECEVPRAAAESPRTEMPVREVNSVNGAQSSRTTFINPGNMAIKSSVNLVVNEIQGEKIIGGSFLYSNGEIIDFLANKTVNGGKVELTDIAFYQRVAEGNEKANTFGMVNMRESFELLKGYAKSQGFNEMRIQFERSANSSSANPGSVFDRTFKIY